MAYSCQLPVTNSARTTRANNIHYTELPRSHVDDEIPEHLRDGELPISFHQRVINLVEIDNANVPNGADQPIGNQELKKALYVCGKEIKISTSIIDKLESRSDTVKAYTHQIMGFFIVFQGVLITVVFKENTSNSFLSRIRQPIMVLSTMAWIGCLAAVIQNQRFNRRLKRRKTAEKNRLKMYERYELELHVLGANFKFSAHQNPKFEPLKDDALIRQILRNPFGILLSYDALIEFIYIIGIIIMLAQFTVLYPKKSTLAQAPAPSISVPSGDPGKTWCIAKVGSADIDVMNGLNFACGEGGADCGAIQVGGACFNPDTIVSHASFAYNTYYQNMGRNSWNCYFGGTGVITITDPSYSGCSFL